MIFNFFRFATYLFLAILLVNCVFALGITPGRTTIDFEPNSQKVVSFSILNSENKDMAILFDIRGDLNSSISLEKSYEEFSSSDSSKSFTYTINLPSEISEPGLHTAEIVATEIPKNFEQSGNVVGARLAVITQLYVNVPYPGKYLKLEPQIINAQEDGTVLFLIAAVNRGSLDIGNAKATVDIYNSFGEKVAVIESDERGILSGQRTELLAKWTADVGSGNYRAVFNVVYDGEIATSENNFKIGEKVLDIQKIEVNNFQLGGIAKFNALVENKWNENVSDAYLNLLIYNEGGDSMADIKSQVYEIDPLSTVNMVAYWDTVGVKKGTYDGKLFLKYSKGSFDRDITVRVSNDEILVMGISGEVLIEKIQNSSLQNILIVSVVILGALNLMWFIVLRKFILKRKKK